MSSVSMFDFRPPPRNDGLPWTTLRVEESADGVGSLGQIDSLAMLTGPGVAPVGLDPDPRYPMARDWTTDNAALAPGVGWYRVRFGDANGDTSEYSAWVKNAPQPWMPTLREVAVHIRARTVERSTNAFKGTFTENTRPSDDEAWEAIELAEADVIAEVGRPDNAAISADGHAAIRSLIALRAAMIIERSYYSEQIGTNKSPYPGLERDWERRLPLVKEAIAEDLLGDITPEEGGEGGTGPVATDSDHVVPAGSRVLSKSGTWVGEGTAQSTFPEDEGGMIDYGTQF